MGKSFYFDIVLYYIYVFRLEFFNSTINILRNRCFTYSLNGDEKKKDHLN